MMEDKDFMIRFHPRVRELDRNYEKLNNQDFDNGVYHKYAYKQKVGNKNAEEVKTEEIKQSDVQMNNLVADKAETARKRRREKADINYHNYYIKISKYSPICLSFLLRRQYHQGHREAGIPNSIHLNVHKGQCE